MLKTIHVFIATTAKLLTGTAIALCLYSLLLVHCTGLESGFEI